MELQINQYPRTLYRNVVSRIRQRRQRYLFRKHALPSIGIDEIAPAIAVEVPPILDDICMPPFYHRQHDDFGPLMRIVSDRKPKLVVELGTAHGNTVANICRINSLCRIVTVNAPADQQSGNRTTYSLTEDEIGRVYRDHGFTDRVTQVFANTIDLELGRFVEKQSVSLAIVDACHDEEYVVNDFLKCLPFVAKDGLILLHDTHPSMKDHLEGSYRACVQLRQRRYDVRHIADTWWGIYSPGASLAKRNR